jgi:hypothetical protein
MSASLTLLEEMAITYPARMAAKANAFMSLQGADLFPAARR